VVVHRVSSLKDVEFWSVSGRERALTQLSDMFSASLMLGSGEQPRGTVWARGKQEVFHAGDILLAEADEIQTVTPSDRPSAIFSIYWPRSALESPWRESGRRGPLEWSLTRLSASPLAAEIAALHALLVSGADAGAIVRAYEAITASILRSASPNPSSATLKRSPCHPGVRRAAKRVRATFAESLTLDDLANELQMSKCHLARCFERSLGVPPHRYRRLLRLQSARRLLERGLSVGEAASETGFADAPHLTRAFRDWLGVSPAAWGGAWRASDPWGKQVPQTIPPPKP